MSRIRAEIASTEAHDLAEGPLWDPEQQRVLWVDIHEGRVRWGRLVGDQVQAEGEHRVDGTLGAAVPTADGGLLVALTRRVATIAPDGTLRMGSAMLPEGVASRFNDGACDPAGRFLIGSMATDDREGEDRLYRVDADGTVDVIDDDLTLSNGLDWSPDGTTLYHIDSVPGNVWARSYDAGTGEVGPRREVVRIEGGAPDGMTVDADGNLWVAVWGAGEVRCMDPGGALLATVEVPAPHTSSVAFVGPDLDRLLITTARRDLSQRQLDQYPLSGHLFLATPGVRGRPATPWAGRCDQIR
ncbi:SMP-30/gluconolactonase/LRE family protein [soil metagenome]